MSRKPRTPQYFPRMKVRGARRRQLAPWQRTAGAIERMGEAFAIAAAQIAQYANSVDAFAALDIKAHWVAITNPTLAERARGSENGDTP